MDSHLREQFQNLRVNISPSKAGNCIYQLFVQNTGHFPLSEISIHYGPLLHPGYFGLDATHMPRDIWVKPAIFIASLLPSQTIIMDVEGSNAHERYDGPEVTRVAIDMHLHTENGQEMGYFLAPVNVILLNARKNNYYY